LDLRTLAPLGGVEPVQLAPAGVRSSRQYLDPHGRRAEHFHETTDDTLARGLYCGAILGQQGGLHGVDGGGEPLGLRQPDLGDRVAAPINRLLGARKPRVIRERHFAVYVTRLATAICRSSAARAFPKTPSRPPHDRRWCAAASRDHPRGAVRPRAAARGL